MHSFARFCYPSFTVSLYRESRATKVVHCITVPSLFGEFYEIFHMKTREHVRSHHGMELFFWVICLDICICSYGSFCYACQEEGWKQQSTASCRCLHFDGLDYRDCPCIERKIKGCHVPSCFRFARFCYPSFTVSLYRESRATKVVHCITVPSLFGEFYEIFHMKTREHVRSSTSWYGAVFLGNLS